MADAGAAKELVEAKHIAAVLTPEKGRAPVLNKDVAALTERMKKEGGKSVFQSEVADKEEDTMVNFDQMKRVLSDEKKRVDGETDPDKKADLQKRYDRLSLRIGIYDKLLNNEGFASMNPTEKADMTKIMSQLPGFSEAVSIATGGRLTIDQVNRILSGRGGVAVTADERKAINAIIEQFANSDKFHSRLAKNLSGLLSVVPEEDATLQNEIDALRTEVGKKGDLQRKKADLQEKIDAYKKLSSTERSSADDYRSRIAENLRAIGEARYKPSAMNLGNINSKIAILDSEITDLKAQAKALEPAATSASARNADAVREYNSLNSTIRQLNATRHVLNDLSEIYQDPNAAKLVKTAEDYATAQTDMQDVDKGLNDITGKERQITEKESKRSQYSDRFKRKMETALPDEMKRFWNDVVINQAVQAANAEISMQGETESGTKTEQQKREDTARAVMDKFLKLSYLRYRDGKVIGFDDKAIKDFMHKDMLSQSPRRLARSMFDRIRYKAGDLPPEYQKEHKKMLADMGVGKGTPPMTVQEALNKLPDSWYDDMAAKKVPDMLGYAWGRGYYFDRMKLKRGEAEFLRHAYPPEFFERAFEARQSEFDMAQKMLNDKILGGDAVTQANLRKVFGEDWTQGMKRVMKTTAVAGALGAGLYAGTAFLGGGSFAGGLATMGGVAEAGKHVALAASKGTAAGIRIASGAIADAAYGIEEAIATSATNIAKANAAAAGVVLPPGFKATLPPITVHP